MHKLHIFIKILYFLHNILYKSRYYVKLKVQIHVVMGNNITVEIVIPTRKRSWCTLCQMY